ncbi:ribulokinase [Meiothermus granaticius]|uniref:Ribulokinase n=1 Tax=Meiothermus granaticius NBRC 107808 TaxID=1227551 RepID=A0A399F413_9DEIN|nr:ribulokinase [Meiothermus granaticius]RIH90833.1 Ribulokinase [Meiothermus granaticius NBRC 107808]GEM88546.1 ribulokinase [Meiothermus granaticius NBRC 107808]
MSERYTVGVDFGTESGRAVVVRVSDGLELASAITPYPHGVMDVALPSGKPLPPEWALQHPEDYLLVFKEAVPAALAKSGVDPSEVVGVGIDFTACTVLPTLSDGTPLCFLPEFMDEPHAYVKLWKHHAAQPQADRINALAEERGETWLPRYGGKISSEWLLAKSLQMLEEAPAVYKRAERILEAADWVVWRLCGRETRNTCTAGYKAIYQDGHYPSREYLAALNPGFADLAETRLGKELTPLGAKAGELTEEAAAWTGLKPGIAVATANVDAHVTVPAAGVVEPGRMVAIMGTSTCHMVMSESLREVPGMCGVVDGGIIPGLYGYEAGQSGVGDIFAWFIKNAAPPEYVSQDVSAHERLEQEAAQQKPGEHGLLALDWVNGNRSVLVDASLSGMILGLTLGTRAPDIYRALIEATAYGTRLIIETFRQNGVAIEEYVAAGGLPKNHMLMQIYADVLGMPISVIDSEQGPALGSAMHAAVAAGIYPDIRAAAKQMGKVRKNAYMPIAEHQKIYDQLYEEYITLHDYFGRGGNDVMRRLKQLSKQVGS